MAFGDLRRQPNLVLIISDQQSGNPHWPDGWADAQLPAMRQLKQTGVTFTNGHTNACTCSPSRATLFTGLYPAHHGVTEVLEFDNMNDLREKTATGVKERRQQGLRSNLQNLAKMLRTAGYQVAYKGKWHLTKPAQFSTSLNQKYWTEADREHLAKYWGFDAWGMPDAGDNLAIANMGGGDTNNDGRFVSGHGKAAKYGELPSAFLESESILNWIEHYDSEQPFCLIVSLVNPHDVLAFPGTGTAAVTIDGQQVPLFEAAGYNRAAFADLPIGLPSTVNESLSTKPKAQTAFRRLSNAGNGVIGPNDHEAQLGYCRFYAYLCRHVDHQILRVLDALKHKGLYDDTVIVRVSDHGDMAMAHGRQRQKMYNVYQETLNIPFVISNPKLFPQPVQTNALASLIDLMPTIATIANVPERERWQFQGNDLTPILHNQQREVQDHLHFTYDDLYMYVPGANHIRCVVEQSWKYAVYYDPFSGAQPEYELYDLAADREERHNLAYPSVFAKLPPTRQAEVQAQRDRLHEKLTHVMTQHGTTPDMIIWPKHSGPSPFASTDLPKHPDDPS